MSILTRGAFPRPNAFEGSEVILEHLPEIGPAEPFRFGCHPQVRCFNECCRELDLALTPFDALRLRRALSEPSESFLGSRALATTDPDTGFPVCKLKMAGHRGRPCPFVSEAGCTIYNDRPSACRIYPLARATRPDGRGGAVERFFVVREDHCRGFDESRTWTAETWMQDQGLASYSRSNDRVMELMARQKDRGGPIEAKYRPMALLALYQPDRFQDFIRRMGLLERVRVDPARQQHILADEEETLRFGMDWLELVLFGKSKHLERTGP